MQVEWAESAYKSLKDVIEYTEEEFGNRQVEIIAKKIADTVQTISVIPNAYPKESLLSRMKGNYHSAVVIRELKIVYRIISIDHILIVFIWNTRMSARKVIEKLKKEKI